MSKASRTNQLFRLDNWNLVYISDSTGWGVARIYSQNIKRDTGKDVQIHDYAIGGLSAIDVLKALQGDPKSLYNKKLKNLRSDIAQAEVIIFLANPSGDPSYGGVQGGVKQCIDYDSDFQLDDITLSLYEPYIKNLKTIYELIFNLRMGKLTIIRAMGFYNPLISEQIKWNIAMECKQRWEIFNIAIQQAAEAFNIPFVHIYDAFNGSNHDEDPREKSYIGSDGEHTTIRGQHVIADLLSEVGYEPLEM